MAESCLLRSGLIPLESMVLYGKNFWIVSYSTFKMKNVVLVMVEETKILTMKLRGRPGNV